VSAQRTNNTDDGEAHHTDLAEEGDTLHEEEVAREDGADDEGGSDDDSNNHEAEEEDGTSDASDEGGGAHIWEDSDTPTVGNEIHDAVDRDSAEKSRMVDMLHGDVVHVPLEEEVDVGDNMTHEKAAAEASHDDDDYTRCPSTDYHPMAPPPVLTGGGGDDAKWVCGTTAHNCWHYSCMMS